MSGSRRPYARRFARQARAYADDLQWHINTFSEPQGTAFENYILALNTVLLDGKDQAFRKAVLSRVPEGMRQRLITELAGCGKTNSLSEYHVS
jgi:hypothetical protein